MAGTMNGVQVGRRQVSGDSEKGIEWKKHIPREEKKLFREND